MCAKTVRAVRVRGAACVTMLWLASSACLGADTAGPQGQRRTPGSFVISVQPDNQGQSLLRAISAARYAIDIVVYEINDPALNAALASAVRRGVNVRMALNGQWLHADDAAQALAMARQVRDAVQAPPGTPGAGRVEVKWASNNFQITHQKTVVIDAHRGAGQVPKILPPDAHAHVLTGNLLAYQYSAAQGEGVAPACPRPCAFWTARDFYVRVNEPALVREIGRVFDSDFACAGSSSTNKLRTTKLPLTWSNGSTGITPAKAGQYPRCGLYPAFSPASATTGARPVPDPGPGLDQGNVRARTLALIEGARQRLDVYNEEMDDDEIESALIAAAQRLAQVKPRGQVRVVMTDSQDWHPAFTRLVNAGVVVHVFPDSTGNLYIHAKVVMADGRSAYIGSTNFSGASMNFNRELGLHIEGRPDVLAPVEASFESDFNNSRAWRADAAPATAAPNTNRRPRRPVAAHDSSSTLPAPWVCGLIDATPCSTAN